METGTIEWEPAAEHNTRILAQLAIDAAADSVSEAFHSLYRVTSTETEAAFHAVVQTAYQVICSVITFDSTDAADILRAAVVARLSDRFGLQGLDPAAVDFFQELV